MRPLSEWLPDATYLVEAEFCLAHPNPVLIFCISASKLRPVERTHGLTIDRAMLAPGGKHGPQGPLGSQLDDYMAFELAPNAKSKSVDITVGCSSHCDVQINDTSVSKLHAYMTVDDWGNWHVRDASSLTGTHVNDRDPIDGTVLHSGDRLSFGLVDLIFLFPTEVFHLVRRLDRTAKRMSQIEQPTNK